MTTDQTTRAIEVRGSEKSFEDQRVLRGVDLRGDAVAAYLPAPAADRPKTA